MLFKCMAICCLVINVQSQNRFYAPVLNPDFLYYPDNLPSAVPLSVPSQNELEQTTIRRIQNETPNKARPITTVEVEKSEGAELGTIVEPEPQGNKRNPLDNRQIPGRETVQQFAPQRPPAPNSNERPSAFQGAQNVQNKPEISLSRPSVAVPQDDRPNRQTVQQTAWGNPNFSPVPLNANRPVGNSLPSLNQLPAGFNKLLYSVTNFGVNLLKNIDALHSGNVVVSPFSITLLLGLVQQGALGQTQAQITTALQMSPETTALTYGRVANDVKGRSSRNILKVVSNMFMAPDFAINRDFQGIAARNFNSEVTPLSFARPEQAARQINSWVDATTNHKIEKLINPDALGLSTQLVLVNAIYFKGLWEVPFRVESTKPRDFQLSNGQTKTVQFMRMRKLFKTGIDKTTNANVILLPFERDEYHLMIILPSEVMGLKNTLSRLTDARLLSYTEFDAMDTELELPKFTIRTDTDLTVALKTMGITHMFRRDYSELNGIGAYGADGPTISSAVHSAILSIDEQGGTAAAATAFAAVALSYDDPAVVLKVNRPFIAVLWDQQSSLPLFMAKIEDPRQ